MRRFIFILLFFLTLIPCFSRTNPSDGWNIGFYGGVFLPMGKVAEVVDVPMGFLTYDISSPYSRSFWFSFGQDFIFGSTRSALFIDELSMIQTRILLGSSLTLKEDLFLVMALGPGLSVLRTRQYNTDDGSNHYYDWTVSALVKVPVELMEVFFLEPFIQMDYLPLIEDQIFYMKSGIGISY